MEVRDVLLIPTAAQTSKQYLRASIETNASYFLIDKFSSRLQAWQGKLLTPAGRLVLIKIVAATVNAHIPYGHGKNTKSGAYLKNLPQITNNYNKE